MKSPNSLISQKIYVGKSKIKNADRGVFANENFQIGETIERCQIIEIPKHEIEFLEHSILTSYIFFFGKKKERMLIAMGSGSIYNHSYSPNAKYQIHSKEKIIEFVCCTKIKKGEEITVNYAPDEHDKVPLWFEFDKISS